jgi:ppGpp synthetase/RelA/SpoT-type nucleotidyltranferase
MQYKPRKLILKPTGPHISVESYFELFLENAGRQAETEIMSALRQTDLLGMCYAYKSRVKSEEKLIEKKNRKLKEKNYYKLQDITDVIGIRFVTLFKFDMCKVFDKIIDIINHNNSLNPNPFKQNSIEEVIIYTANKLDDIIYDIEKVAKAKNLSIVIETKQSKEGYSSIHIVTRHNKEQHKLNTDLVSYYIPIEIQIRTVFEDAWGEIDHKYGYIVRSGKDTGAPVENPESVLRHLRILKKFADACAEYADAIYFEATTNKSGGVDSPKVISVGADEELIEDFKALGVNQEDIERFVAARVLRLEAQDKENEKRGKGFSLFLQAAEMFRELAKPFLETTIVDNNEKDYLFYCYVKMNEAFCLLSLNQKETAIIALTIYDHLRRLYPDFTLVKMRLGQAYGANQEVEQAISMLNEAYNEIKLFEKNGCSFSNTLPKIDYDHMKKHLPKVYGYELWRKAEQFDETNLESLSNKAELIEKAFTLTTETLEYVGNDDLNVHNNLLYYGIMLTNLYKKLNKNSDTLVTTDDIKRSLDVVSSKCSICDCDDIEILDTLMVAYDLVGEKDKVIKITDKFIILAENALSMCPCDSDLILQMEKKAIELKQKYAG